MLRVLSMIATSLAIAPATATWGSGTIASEAFIGSICPDRGKGQERLSGGAAPLIGVLPHPVHSEGRVALDERADIYQGRPAGVGSPEGDLALGIRSHENGERLVMSPYQGR